MTVFYANGIKHTHHTNKSTGFPKLIVNGSYFLAFPDKGYKSKYEFGEWMYFEGPVVLTKNGTRYRVAASGLGGFSTARYNAYFSYGSGVSNVDYRPTVGSYYPGSQIYSNYSVSDGTIYFSGNRSGTHLCLSSGRVYSHWTPGWWTQTTTVIPGSGGYGYGYGGGGGGIITTPVWHPGYWTTSVEPSSFKQVD